MSKIKNKNLKRSNFGQSVFFKRRMRSAAKRVEPTIAFSESRTFHFALNATFSERVGRMSSKIRDISMHRNISMIRDVSMF